MGVQMVVLLILTVKAGSDNELTPIAHGLVHCYHRWGMSI